MRRLQISTVLLSGTLALLLTGCSRNPMSPDPTGAPQGGASMMGAQMDDTPSAMDGGTPTVAQVTMQVNRDGRLTVGRFTLDLHKNSLKMPATITMRVASEDATEVEFEVVPAAANDFKVPPKLYANMSDRPSTNWATVTMWNWKNESWTPGDGVSANATEQNVMAHMKNLSKTKVGEPEEGSVVTAEEEKSR